MILVENKKHMYVLLELDRALGVPRSKELENMGIG